MTELHFLTDLISSILYNLPLPEIPSELNWERFADIVLQNSFVGLVYNRLLDVEHIPEKVMMHFKKVYMGAVRRSVSQEYYIEQLLTRFEKEKIKCLPLKGIILRDLYPAPVMRSMTDLDILVDSDKLEETRSIMKDLGFEIHRYDTHHDIYHMKPKINVELHKMLIVGEMEDYFQIGFERAHLREGSEYIYEMSLEDFYIHMLGHMAYHFAHGGVGIRLVLDIQVYLNHYGDVLNRLYVEQELEKVGLRTFAKHMETLAGIWFAGGESNPFYDELGDYIVKSRYLGSPRHKEILEVVKWAGSKNRENGREARDARAKAVLTAIFLPYKYMAFLYPILKKHPLLLPGAWIARWIKILMVRRENILRLKGLSKVDDMEMQKLRELYDTLEMRHLL